MTNQVKKIGLLSAVGLIVANMMGSGIALLPASLASIGSITIWSWLITIIGAVALAYVYASLASNETTTGGPVAYAKEVSNMLGYQTSIMYYVANWLGNLAILSTALAYSAAFFPSLNNKIPMLIFGVVVLVLFTFINLRGSDWVSKISTIGVVLMLIPIILTAIFGWFYFSMDQYIANWTVNASTGNPANIISGVVLCLWCFIGLESASVNARDVKNPEKNVSKATMIGVAFAGIIYVISTQVIFGMYPNSEIASSSAPFAMTSETIFGKGLANFSIIATVITCFTCLLAWMLLVANSGKNSADQGDFPESWKEVNEHGSPTKILWITCIEMCVAWVFFVLLSSTSAVGMFTGIISIATTLTLIPYFYSAVNLIRFTEEKKMGFISLLASIIGIIFCCVAIISSGMSIVSATFIVTLIIIAFYANKEGKQQYNEEQSADHSSSNNSQSDE